jgi:hypothetical protein
MRIGDLAAETVAGSPERTATPGAEFPVTIEAAAGAIGTVGLRVSYRKRSGSPEPSWLTLHL